ncbi:MAG: HAD family hydrolase [Chloroflexi bacterium]|nr:HAD family hydrolase [Chloroflexota bacterium]
MIRAVLFDMDETLLDRQASLRAFAAAQYSRHRDRLAGLSVDSFVERFIELDNNGALWKDEVYRRILDEHRIAAIDPQSLLAEYIAGFHCFCQPFPGLGEMAAELIADGRRLGLITNGLYPFQWRNFQALGVAHSFSAVLVSEKEGVRKPDPEIFRRALARLGVTADEAVFVGDNPEADIRGAQRVGMRTVYRPNRFWPECPLADAVCTDLHELPAILRGFEVGP